MLKLCIAIYMIVVFFLIKRMKHRSRLFEIFTSSLFILTFICNTIFAIYTLGWHGLLTHELPLYHCSFGMMAQMYFFFFNKESNIYLKHANVIALGGAVSAIFFSGLITSNYLLYSVLVYSHLIYYTNALYCIFVRDIRMHYYEYYPCIVSLAGYDILIFTVNAIFNTNYSFVYSSPLGLSLHPLFTLLANFILFLGFYLFDYVFICRKER